MTKKQSQGIAGKIWQQWHRLHDFVQDELLNMDLATLPGLKRNFFAVFRIATIAGKSVTLDKCPLQAAALSYITLASTVPVLALVFAVSKGFGISEHFMTIIRGNLDQLPPSSADFIIGILNDVESVKTGTLGSVGLLLIFFGAIKTLGRIEYTFNSVWGVTEARPLVRKFTDYISVLVVVPVLILAATSFNTLMSSNAFSLFLENRFGPVYFLYQKVISLTGLLFLFIAFSFLYWFMPNTRVKFFPALVGGVCGGCLWFAAQRAYILLQIGITKENAVYGTFAAIPFFLTWLFVSWLIVLVGAEIAYAVQNHNSFLIEVGTAKTSYATKELLGLAILYDVSRHFENGHGSWSVMDYADEHNVPARLLCGIAAKMADERLLIQVDSHSSTYVPGKDLRKTTLLDAVIAFRGKPDDYALNLIAKEAAPALAEFQRDLQHYESDLGKVSFLELIDGDIESPPSL